MKGQVSLTNMVSSAAQHWVQQWKKDESWAAHNVFYVETVFKSLPFTF